MKYKLLLLLSLLTLNGFSQNYYEEYPINVSVTTNGTQKQIQCSTYDSVLQTTVNFNTNWITANNIVFSGMLPGKICYTLWNSPVSQIPQVGFIIYDSYSHEFVSQEINVPLISNQTLNVVCGPVWIEIVKQRPWSGYYLNERTYYRYNNLFNKWIIFDELYDYSNTPDIWTIAPIGNTDRLVDSDDYTIIYYDPVIDSMNYRLDGNGVPQHPDWEDCHIGDNEFYMHDPQLHQFVKHPRGNIIGDEVKGIFYGSDIDSTFKKFFFLYDLSTQQWVTDSVYSLTLANIKINDRVVAYTDSSSGLSKKVFCMVYNPITHNWIKDSVATLGIVTGLQIQNGTVKWSDSNGLHIRGYDATMGWGSYNTVLLLNFHLTDFSIQGYNMIHVRNYSIGSDSIFFDFGDGVVSSNNRNVLWHTYNESGNYNVCIYDSTGMVSWCQQISLNICAIAGSISASNDTICLGDSVVFSIPNYVGNVQWQSQAGNNWIDETDPGATSPTYIVSPTLTTRFRAKVTNGNCVPDYSFDKKLTVIQPIGNMYVSDTALTLCSNTSTTLELLGASTGAQYQWQYNTGSGWANIINSNNYWLNISFNANISCRVIVSKWVCDVDTSISVPVTVVNAPPVPTTIPDQRCGPGYVDLEAIGVGTMLWKINTYDSLVYIGNSYSPYISATKTFTVTASDSAMTASGYINNSIGTVTSNGNQKNGIRFNTTSPAYIEYFYIYPQQPGTARIRLIHSNSKRIIKIINVPVLPDSNGVKIWFRTALT
ncbi:MAG: hypothetical protein H0V14_07455, partial [Chitinophagaceae bacterium]|nr:hypothetical protein [Chitinophagaceae bacterium]